MIGGALFIKNREENKVSSKIDDTTDNANKQDSNPNVINQSESLPVEKENSVQAPSSSQNNVSNAVNNNPSSAQNSAVNSAGSSNTNTGGSASKAKTRTS